MSMTRKDFERIADVFADVWAMLDDPKDWLDQDGKATWGTLRARIADACADSNPAFKPDTFYARTARTI